MSRDTRDQDAEQGCNLCSCEAEESSACPDDTTRCTQNNCSQTSSCHDCNHCNQSKCTNHSRSHTKSSQSHEYTRVEQSLDCTRLKEDAYLFVLLTSLNIADLMASVYLSIISIATQLYKGEYVLREAQWAKSGTCKMAGFLFALSHQASMAAIVVTSIISLTRLRSSAGRIGCSKKSLIAACVNAWAVSALSATMPLFLATAAWSSTYSHNGNCFPLPATDSNFPGHHYHLGMVGVQKCLLTFLLIKS
jgi:hypothetical protein